jgi:hypothetical protein
MILKRIYKRRRQQNTPTNYLYKKNKENSLEKQGDISRERKKWKEFVILEIICLF